MDFTPRTESYIYDSQGRIIEVTTIEGGYTKIASYTYNVDGVLESITITVN